MFYTQITLISIDGDRTLICFGGDSRAKHIHACDTATTTTTIMSATSRYTLLVRDLAASCTELVYSERVMALVEAELVLGRCSMPSCLSALRSDSALSHKDRVRLALMSFDALSSITDGPTRISDVEVPMSSVFSPAVHSLNVFKEYAVDSPTPTRLLGAQPLQQRMRRKDAGSALRPSRTSTPEQRRPYCPSCCGIR